MDIFIFVLDESEGCEVCDIGFNSLGRPDTGSFARYLPYFLEDNPDYTCAKAGHAAYSHVCILCECVLRLPLTLF